MGLQFIALFISSLFVLLIKLKKKVMDKGRSELGTSKGFPSDSVSKESSCSAGDASLILGSRKSPGGGNGDPLQYSCLKNPIDRGAWWATVQKVEMSQTQLSA